MPDALQRLSLSQQITAILRDEISAAFKAAVCGRLHGHPRMDGQRRTVGSAAAFNLSKVFPFFFEAGCPALGREWVL